jgi:hypothetical protein
MRPADLDVRAIAEVLADVLIERGLVVAGCGSGGRVLDATAVAALLGRERQWVYDHANELGAFRYGDGPRSRLGFDLHSVERWKRERLERDTQSTRGCRRASTPGRVDAVTLIPYEGSGRGA